MNKKNKNDLYLRILLIAALVLGSLFLLTQLTVNKMKEASQNIIQEGDVTENKDGEQEVSLVMGSKEASGGYLKSLSGGKITLVDENGKLLEEYPLTEDEVAIACTTEDLKSKSDVSLDAIEHVEVLKPSELASKLDWDGFTGVILAEMDGEMVAHTLVVPSAVCEWE